MIIITLIVLAVIAYYDYKRHAVYDVLAALLWCAALLEGLPASTIAWFFAVFYLAHSILIARERPATEFNENPKVMALGDVLVWPVLAAILITMPHTMPGYIALAVAVAVIASAIVFSRGKRIPYTPFLFAAALAATVIPALLNTLGVV